MKTVKELKEILATMPDDSVVVMACDAEGNAYSPLSDVSTGKYEAETTWRGTFLNVDEMEDSDGACCVALFPVN